jgi:hypothetical protein
MNSYSFVDFLFQEYVQTKINPFFIYYLIIADKASAMHHAHQSIRQNLYQTLFCTTKLTSYFPLSGFSLLSPSTNYFIYQNYQFSQSNLPSVPGSATAVTVAAPHHMWPVLR